MDLLVFSSVARNLIWVGVYVLHLYIAISKHVLNVPHVTKTVTDSGVYIYTDIPLVATPLLVFMCL